MRFIDIVTATEQLAQVTNQRAQIKRNIRSGLEYVASLYDWPHYRTRSFLTTVAPYSTGTAAMTNGSTAVTGTSTVWTSAMVGRKIRFGSETAYYTISSFTSTTSITLTEAYQGTTSTSSTYSIYQDEYRLVGDVDKPKLMRQVQNGVALFDMHYSEFDVLYPSPNATGDPTISVPIGRQPDTYATGTVATTVNSATITGASTAWTDVQGLSRGNRIAVRATSEVFTILSVDSATQITAYEAAESADSSSNYTIFLDNIVIQLHAIPDAARNIYYRYGRIPKPPVNDWDEPDMPRSWHYMLVWYAAMWMFSTKGEQGRQMAVYAEAQFLKMLNAEIAAIGHQSADRVYLKQDMDQGVAVGLSLRNYPGNYGVPFGR